MNIEEAGHANALETPPSRFLSRRFESGHALQIRNHLSENWGDFSFDHRNTTDGFQKIFGMAGCYLPSMPQFIIFGILYSSDFILGNQSGIMRLIQA